MKPFDKLKIKLSELFQLDQADLDFGIYRIMNARREEIVKFLDKELLPQVQEAFLQYKSSDKAEILQEIEKAVKGAEALGMDPETVPKVKELQLLYDSSIVDITALENEVYDHLYSFFNRYYDEGDFISLRRYKEGVYAIPYEGEEVKLHWANHDQYYIKTTENFRDYAFKLPSGKRVHFKIVEADTEKDNVKAANGKDRRFILKDESPVSEENGELVIRFAYLPDQEKRKQDDLNREAITTVLATKGIDPSWVNALLQAWYRSGGSQSNKTVLERHLYDYTRRNTFDYFIHKDLGKFLRQELDFYIKNEVMHLDDVENESAPRVEQYLSKIKVIRKIAHKIIEFLAQIEDFQKKLWLKKKFVVETNYCVTLDRVPDALYPEIAKNNAQRTEWVKLFAIDEIRADLADQVAYSNPLTVEFLKANPYLVVDTKFFEQELKDKLLTGLENMDDTFDGILVHGDNFHALKLLSSRYHSEIKCFYIDPPYNTGDDGFAYKDNYQHASWLTFVHSRLSLVRQFLKYTGVIFSSIDDIEYHNLRQLFCELFGNSNFIDNIIWKKRYGGGAKEKYLVSVHEYIIFFANDQNVLKDIFIPLDEVSITRYYKLKDKYFAIRGPYRTHPLEATKSVGIRENLIYPIPAPDGTNILPERQWWWEKERTMKALNKGELEFIKTDNGWKVHTKQYLKDEHGLQRQTKAASIIDNIFTQHGTTEIGDLFGDSRAFLFPKPSALIGQLLKMAMLDENDVVMDIVAGSGTTAHAVITNNRISNFRCKYILVEMGDYFDTVLKPRIQKVVYSKDWKDGKPVSRNTGVSHMFKYIRLESYEDALANLQFRRTPAQQSLLDQSASFRESYMLSYLLDMETKDSPSLLNIDRFDDPFSYQLLIGTSSVGETKPINVDLVETFNWLLGLKVKHIDCIEGFRIVEGTNPKGEKALVIWRKIRDLEEAAPEKIRAARERANEAMETFFRKQQYNTMEMEFDVIYVNGDNNLMNIPIAPEGEGQEPRYKVRLIEEEFKRLMFDVKDV